MKSANERLAQIQNALANAAASRPGRPRSFDEGAERQGERAQQQAGRRQEALQAERNGRAKVQEDRHRLGGVRSSFATTVITPLPIADAWMHQCGFRGLQLFENLACRDFTKRQCSRIIRPNRANYRTPWNYALQNKPCSGHSTHVLPPIPVLPEKVKTWSIRPCFFVGEEE